MKKLTKQEFSDRIDAIARARKIFMNLTNNNITNAFILYQEVLAEQERAIAISDVRVVYKGTVFDTIVRPKCPECGSDMNLRPLNDNEEGFKTLLICSNSDCDVVLNSEMDTMEWLKSLEKIDGSE